MMSKLKYCIYLLLLITVLPKAYAQNRVVQYVDPFIGTENSGNVFPGPSMPFGMARLSPDCQVINGKSPNTNSGYVSGGQVYGFSHMHVSGTGGGAKYGNIQIMPITGAVNLKDHQSSVKQESAAAGYYTALLERYTIKAELTVTHSTGLHRYTFPETQDAHILIDAASFLVKGSTVQKLVNSSIKVISPTEVEGFGTVAGGWNEGAPYTVFFYAQVSKPAKGIQTWFNGVLSTNREVKPVKAGGTGSSGAVLSYTTQAGEQLIVKVGISFVSTQKAKQNLEKESLTKSFDQIRKSASAAWNQLLQRVQVEGENTADKTRFYTALYHVMLMPSNRTGENPLWKSKEPYYDDYYAIWDTYRVSNPLITLIDQKRQEDIIRSLIDIYNHEGYMPDARSGNDNGLIQGGTNSDMLIADALAKKLPNIDYAKAYEAMAKNAETEPVRPKKEGREGISKYKALGYVPYGISIAGSRTLEYANNDAAVASVAKRLKKDAEAAKYLKRASNWQNLWRPVTNHGANGFIWPKNESGEWEPDFDFFKRGTFKGYLYEGDSWTYSFYVPQDVKKLIEVSGGKQAFISRLDTFFTNKYYDVNNEPGFLTPCLYIWAGRPDKTSERVNAIRAQYYNTLRGGLPGNDDSGAMSGWFAMHSMGFYPNAGQDVYLVTAPLFKKVTVNLLNGKKLTVNAIKLTAQNIYIQSATLNGKNWDKAWFRHGDIINGATLNLMMGSKPSNWGTQNSPPSLLDNQQKTN
ncbi:GH92 family glycosyl hydrolase [Mucilaginibacter sp. PAMB04274]|uniref:GH92 family glycosyl hydrolase n=1 Tax=Mucilaginibacter sp. PAMB04274 TaxID=3138568 RepID=UPI0031F668B7